MKADDESLDAILDRMGRKAAPPAGQLESSVDAVWERLRSEADRATLPPRELTPRRSHLPLWAAAFAATAALGLFGIYRGGLPPTTPLVRHLQEPAPPMPSTVPQSREAETELAESGPESQRPRNTAARDERSPSVSAVGRSQNRPVMSFEVASVRPIASPSPAESGPRIVGNGQFRAERGYLRDIIGVAYGVPNGQVKGGPEWLDREPFDVDARAANPSAGGDQIRAMLQTLLTERFKLAVRRETEEFTAYSLEYMDAPYSRSNQADSRPDIDQLGLRLVATKRQVDVIMIDRIERPALN